MQATSTETEGPRKYHLNTPSLMLQNWIQGFREMRQFQNWPQVLINRLLFRSEGLCVYRRNGMEILIDHAGGDQNGTRPCLVSDMYSRYFPHFSEGGALRVLDLGANGGGFILSLIDHGLSLESVVCVEFNPQTFLRLHFNVSRNFHGEKHLINAAVWHENSTLNVTLGHGSTSEGLGTSLSTGEGVAVEARTLDSIVAGAFPSGIIDLCKMDIEGAEHDVLLSASANSIRRVRRLVIEIHPHARSTTEGLLAQLKAFGFSPVPGAMQNEGDCTVWLLQNEGLIGR